MWTCFLEMENVRRGDICPNNGLLYCDNVFYDSCPECGHDCAHIRELTDEYILLNDSSNDGYINALDTNLSLADYTDMYSTCD